MAPLNQGFTLIELIITLALASVVVGLAVPSVGHMIRTNAVVSINNVLFVDILFTRSEAIKRNTPVTICAANDTFSACIVSDDWSKGWISFVESVDFNGVVDGATETIIRSNPGSTSATMTIQTSGNMAGDIGYQGDGYPIIPSVGTLPNGAFLICEDNDVSYSRKIEVNQTGRVQSVGVSDSCGA